MITSSSLKYARALAEVAGEMGIAESAGSELARFVAVLREHRELSGTMESPALPLRVKQSIAEEVLSRLEAPTIVRNFVLLLIERSRLSRLPEILEAYGKVLDDLAGVVRVGVHSAHQLSPQMAQRLEAALRNATKREVRLNYQLDETLIAGLRVQIGSTVLDGSVRARLEELQKELSY